MSWHEPTQINVAFIRRLMSLIDLTSLNEADTAESLPPFFEKAQNDMGHVASVCVLPRFVGLAKAQFAKTPVLVGTVANFPTGNATLESVLIEINQALEAGADEIDVVLPYTRYLSGDRSFAHAFIEACKAACGDAVTLKVILETGVLKESAIIEQASMDVIVAGADFIKTSTGKIAQGATLEAAATMLAVIKGVMKEQKKSIGFKASGGIREIQEAAQYVALGDQILGEEGVNPRTFRIGASLLVDRLLRV